MFENPAKGWHGSFSTVGRSSAEKYHLILIKDYILSEREKKKEINLFSSIEAKKNEKIKLEKNVDIFEEPPIKEKIDKMQEIISKRKEICEPYSTNSIPEKYKYHQHHHKELHNYNLLLKNSKRYTSGSGNYNPKMDYIWKKTITGPSWDIISGREKKVIEKKKSVDSIKLKKRKKIKKEINDTENISKKSLTLGNFRFTNKNIINKNQFLTINNKRRSSIYIDPLFVLPMNKQTKRGDLPVAYDSRIRNDKAYEIKENENDDDNDKISINIKKDKIYKIGIHKKKKELTDSKKINSSKSIYKDKDDEQKNSKNTLKINNYIDFSKTLSREQYYNILRDKNEIHPFCIPNYSQVEPRSLTMVSYTTKVNRNKIKKKLKGVDNTLFYNPDKVINKVNNHKQVSVPNFKIMVSRPNENTPLPSFMVKKFDRASLEALTREGLKMNKYADVGFNTHSSSFYPKRSYNRVINYNLLNSDIFVDYNLDDLLKKMNSSLHMKKLFELYSKNTEEIQETNLPQFDSITFRTIHNERKKRTKFD